MSKTGMFSIGGIFLAYGIYAIAQTRANPQVLAISVAVVSALGGVGLILDHRWSRICIYLVSFGLTATWLYYTGRLAIQAWPYNSVAETVIALLPGALIVFIAAGSSYLVTKHFNAEPRKN